MSCKKLACLVCGSIRKPVFENIIKIFDFFQWKKEILQRFDWLLKFGGLPNSQLSVPMQIHYFQKRYQVQQQLVVQQRLQVQPEIKAQQRIQDQHQIKAQENSRSSFE